MNHPAQFKLSPERAALVIVDIQERLAAAMDPDVLAALEKSVTVLVELARRLELPVVASEQYPRGLGKTREAVQSALLALGERVYRFEKTEFSICASEGFAKAWDALAGERTQWIVVGMEAHVCVYQSVRDLLARGGIAHVPRDAVISRAEENRETGLDLMDRAGALITSTETVVFDALGRAGTDDFKAMSRLVK